MKKLTKAMRDYFCNACRDGLPLEGDGWNHEVSAHVSVACTARAHKPDDLLRFYTQHTLEAHGVALGNLDHLLVVAAERLGVDVKHGTVASMRAGYLPRLVLLAELLEGEMRARQ